MSAYRNIYRLYKRSPFWIVTKQKPVIGEAKAAIGTNVPLYIIKCEKWNNIRAAANMDSGPSGAGGCHAMAGSVYSDAAAMRFMMFKLCHMNHK